MSSSVGMIFHSQLFLESHISKPCSSHHQPDILSVNIYIYIYICVLEIVYVIFYRCVVFQNGFPPRFFWMSRRLFHGMFATQTDPESRGSSRVQRSDLLGPPQHHIQRANQGLGHLVDGPPGWDPDEMPETQKEKLVGGEPYIVNIYFYNTVYNGWYTVYNG